ncbi:hypothetical protein ACFFGR_09470 [Arthrobacter liuii]|uniref:HNH endonuclease n=1 Tax=Arthrobacter liuii TaxID=1476996 RepID=A0ABQ2AM56_9MICC|nr:hypothetical protein [Arthrobacter liuii]GGH93928.1 hypothetical protein GCM10007170_15940 [Arthrobacter liuii]
MKAICPGCGRATFWRFRDRKDAGKSRPALPEGFLSAVTADGACMTCWRARNGKTRAIPVDPALAPRGISNRAPMTEEQITAARMSLARFTEDRRVRGIPAEGINPWELHRPGLSLLEA